jgi:uncharacterized glyoxalase superfamily protein PhnB
MNELKKNRSAPSPVVVPVLPYPDVRAAVAWLERVFGFTERLQIADHRAQMNTGGGGAVIVAEYIDRARRPQAGADHATHAVMVRVPDVMAHHQRAVACGADVLQAPVDHVYGERQYVVRDIGGHHWTFSETLFDADPKEWGGDGVALKGE